MTGRTYFEGGDWNAACFRCGFKFKASELRPAWQGFKVCEKCWEPRHPQDFVRAVKDDSSVPWAQDDDWTFGGPNALLCTVVGRSAIPSYAVSGCSISGTQYSPN